MLHLDVTYWAVSIHYINMIYVYINLSHRFHGYVTAMYILCIQQLHSIAVGCVMHLLHIEETLKSRRPRRSSCGIKQEIRDKF